MKQKFLPLILIMCMNITNLFAQSYDDLWAAVGKLTIEDRPQSVIEEAKKILDKAEKEKNFPQMLKAKISITEMECELDPERFAPDEYEKMIEDLDNDKTFPAEDRKARLAIMHTLIASQYLNMRYTFAHVYDMEVRTEYPIKAKDHYIAALSDMDVLANTTNRDYIPLIKQDTDGNMFSHDLLSVILYKATENGTFDDTEKKELYERAIPVYENLGNRNAVALLRIRLLALLKASVHKSIRISEEQHRHSLLQLHATTQDIDAGIDVDKALLDTYEGDERINFARAAIQHWKDNKRVNWFKRAEADLLATHIHIEAPSPIIANKPFTFAFTYNNAEAATITIREYNGLDKRDRLLENGKKICTRTYTLPLDPTNLQRKADNMPTEGTHKDQVTLPPGHYVVIAECNGDKSVREWQITSMRLAALPLPDNKNTLVTCLDNETGRPVSGATILCFNDWHITPGKKAVARYTTDKNGQVVIPVPERGNSHFYYRVLACRNMSNYGKPNEDITDLVNISKAYDARTDFSSSYIKVFTDRSIYRPGQTVHGYALYYQRIKDDFKALANRKIPLAYDDVDGKKTVLASVTTNELGSAEFEFQLPADGKLGRYILYPDNGYRYNSSVEFRMEEYKRPTFTVTIDKAQADTPRTVGKTYTIEANANMFSGAPVQDAKVRCTVEWKQDDYFYWRETWNTLDIIETTTSADGTITLQVNTELPEVVYSKNIKFRLNCEVKDMSGEMESETFTFTANNPDYKDIPKKEEAKDELTISTKEISEGNDAHVSFKAKEDDALVFYCIMSNDKIEKRDSKVLSGKELKFDIKYQKAWGDGVTLYVYYVRNGHFFQKKEILTRKEPEKKLTLQWKTFRDNLIPGAKEEWTLTVLDHNKKVVSGAELLAVMYDASLDDLYPHDWNMSLEFPRALKSYHLENSYGNFEMSHTLSVRPPYYLAPDRYFDSIIDFEHNIFYHPKLNGRISGKMMMARKVATSAQSIDAPVMEDGMDKMMNYESGVAYDMADHAAGMEPEAKPTSSVRENLSELAFFYPHIVTDSNGEAHIAFTLPDCLTKWKFMALAHTSLLDYGTITATATAKKDFMVQPNMPRFLRTADKAVIAAKIMNLSDKPVRGTATLRILRADNEEVVMTRETTFAADTASSVPVTFSLSPLAEGDYICEIVASDGMTSDGERNRLPVLSTKVDVVENIPFYLDDAGTKSVDLSSLFNAGSTSATDKNVQIGYTDNPAIPVFEQLRAFQLPEHDNAPDYAAALYSNLVLLDLSKVIGEHIKDFNPEKAKDSADKALKKLDELQLSDGSWAWFKGMKGNSYITLSVAESLDRLVNYCNSHDTKAPASVESMLKKALKYLDRKELEIFKHRRQHKLSLVPSNEALRYLAIAANPDKTLVDTYLNEYINEFRNLTIYGRAKGVLLLDKYNRKEQADRFLTSVKEYTVFKPGFGRYFATDIAYYSWMDYRIPTQLAAMRAVKSHPTNGGTSARKAERAFLLDMQLWLLRQKQTQVWKSPINALDVADFLLSDNRETVLHAVTTPTLVLDGKSMVQDSTYTVNKVKSLSVTKTSPGISWGHVRGTFKEEVSHLNSYSSGELTIERKVIRNGNKVIIRHILHADRDMDFVSVTSEHAACLEPLRTLSGYQMMGGRGCYLEVHDSHINLFFDTFTRGTTTIDMEYYIARDGDYSNGHATIECKYAPEYGAHTKGEDIKVK